MRLSTTAERSNSPIESFRCSHKEFAKRQILPQAEPIFICKRCVYYDATALQEDGKFSANLNWANSPGVSYCRTAI
jgi:hypothetical protein